MFIILLYILNLFDAAVTYWILVKFGSSMELNPLMKFLFDIGIFLPVKIIVMGILCGILWKYFEQHKKLILFLNFIYGILAIYHCINLGYYFLYLA